MGISTGSEDSNSPYIFVGCKSVGGRKLWMNTFINKNMPMAKATGGHAKPFNLSIQRATVSVRV